MEQLRHKTIDKWVENTKVKSNKDTIDEATGKEQKVQQCDS